MAALRVVSGAACRRFVNAHASLSQLSRSHCLSRRGLASAKQPSSLFTALDTFPDRHIGPDDAEAAYMLSKLGCESMEAFVQEAVPPKVRIPLTAMTDKVIESLSENELNLRVKQLGKENKQFKSYIGMGYHNAVVPPVILRNVSEALLITV